MSNTSSKRSLGGKLSPPTFKSSGGMGGMNPLIAYMLLQQRGQETQRRLPVGSVITGATEPGTGIQSKTPEGISLEAKQYVMQKASDDRLKLGQSYKFIESLENDYNEAYSGMADQSGLAGGWAAAKELIPGVLGRRNSALRRYIRNREASGIAIGKFSGDTGNFAWQEQQSHLKRLPVATLNTQTGNLFLPDDPEFGKQQFQNIKDIYQAKMSEADYVSRTGEVTPSYKAWLGSQGSSQSSPLQQQTSQPQGQDKISKLRQRYLRGA